MAGDTQREEPLNVNRPSGRRLADQPPAGAYLISISSTCTLTRPLPDEGASRAATPGSMALRSAAAAPRRPKKNSSVQGRHQKVGEEAVVKLTCMNTEWLVQRGGGCAVGGWGVVVDSGCEEVGCTTPEAGRPRYTTSSTAEAADAGSSREAGWELEGGPVAPTRALQERGDEHHHGGANEATCGRGVGRLFCAFAHAV
jgi:hypothetical protein